MKKIAVVLIPLLVLTLFFGALGCGDDESTPTPTPTVEPTLPPTPEATASPTPTTSPTATPLKTPPAPDNVSGPPCRFHGTVTLNGAAAPAGTSVTVVVLGYGYPATVTTVGGSTSYSVVIPKGEGLNFEGQAVTFRVGSATAVQVSAWSQGGNVLQNLIASTP